MWSTCFPAAFRLATRNEKYIKLGRLSQLVAPVEFIDTAAAAAGGSGGGGGGGGGGGSSSRTNLPL